jgi:hypothetical protein
MLSLQLVPCFTRYYKSIATTKSFPASPQEYYKVLNEAAVAGKIDYLEGLKEM